MSIPAKAGTHLSAFRALETWAPAFAGMGLRSYSSSSLTRRMMRSGLIGQPGGKPTP
jgi:hypothetical protein